MPPAQTAPTPFDLVLVPQGAEAQAVRRGLKQAQASLPIFPLAMGPTATAQRLSQALAQGHLITGSRALVLGVAGSLAPSWGVGDLGIYQQVVSEIGNAATNARTRAVTKAVNAEVDAAAADLPEAPAPAQGGWGGGDDPVMASRWDGVELCKGEGGMALLERLPQARWVTALSSDRLIHQASEKSRLYTKTGAEVVDMEAAAIAQTLIPQGIQVTTLRIISDDSQGDLPDLAAALRADGSLDNGRLAIALVRQPRAAVRLVRGSLTALKVLEQATYRIFSRP